jgi:hypothetical protein
MPEQNLPLDEKKPLNGKYKVSFDVEVNNGDDLTVTDIVQAIASGFEESPVLSKIANLNFTQYIQPTTLKIGDIVIVKEEVKITANILEEDGYYVVGELTDKTNLVGEMCISVPAGSKATVNQIVSNGVELVEFDMTTYAPLQDPETYDIVDTPVILESITLNPDILEKVDE